MGAEQIFQGLHKNSLVMKDFGVVVILYLKFNPIQSFSNTEAS